MAQDTINNDLFVSGNFSCKTFTPPAGSIVAASMGAQSVTTTALTTTLGTGIIFLDLTTARVISANDIQALAADGGMLAKDSAPILERVNGATDKRLRVKWAATVVAEIQFSPFAIPPDCDVTQPLTVKVRAKMTGSTDTPVLTISYWDNDTGSNIGGNTAALSSAFQTVSINVNGVTAPPARGNLTILPAAHGTDAVELDAIWIEYTRK